uniref:Pollen coat oleosin-glycine rich protein n=1 Tax=Sisymbrium irio TaxID=3730 RepID=Q6V5I6_SISIR|nr:pollen coat oleosin-glycine rich protein [Sisymbrium irio]
MLSCLIPIFQVFQIISAAVVSAALFAFAGLTLACSVLALIVATPLFVIFSPVLVPATIATTLLATNLSASAFFGVTAIALIIWLLKHRMGVKPKDNPPPAGAPPTGAAKPTKKSTDKLADKPAEMPADKPTGGPKDKPTKMPGDKPVGGSTDKLGDKPIGGSTDKLGDKPAGGPTGKPTDKPFRGPANKPPGGIADKLAGAGPALG